MEHARRPCAQYRLARHLTAALVALSCAACATPLVPAPKSAPSLVDNDVASQRPLPEMSRPAIGVAFGGGSARGIAHVGVIRWFEEHRIPIDVAAGTSMGGLVGGGFAAGMNADELETFVGTLNWDQLFGASTFAYRNIRRKADARAYPSDLEFGIKGGIAPPTALNNGEYIELLVGRIAAPYFDVDDFDELPTPFRTVAVDLLSAKQVVMRRGSLADALRATMSLPLVFPPVEVDGQVLVDGGAMNNVPADVVKAMGADRVVAVNVGDLADPGSLDRTMLGIAGSTLDAMMRATTARGLESADVVINVPLKEYGSLDWRRAADLMQEGYRAAEAMRDQLQPLAVSEVEFEAWQRARHDRRRTSMPAPAFVDLEGFSTSEMRHLNALLSRHVGAPLDVGAVDADIVVVSSLDRYETVTWRMIHDPARGYGIRVRGRAKPYAPPYLMLGLNLENTTSADFRVTTTARYLTFDVVGSGSELRIDGTIGSNPSAAIELYRPIGSSPLFVAPYAGVGTATFDVISDDAVLARYGQTRSRAGLNLGANLGTRSDLRVGAYAGRTSASIEFGDPGLPELAGKETGAEIVWRVDTQDSPVVPAGGTHSRVRLSHTFDSPDLAYQEQTLNSAGLTQFSVVANRFFTVNERHRLFAYGGFGTSFADVPLPTSEFELGSPFRLGAYGTGELRGSHYYVLSGGYLHQIARLPDFLGGPVFTGAWVENGDAFDEWSLARWRTNGGAGLVMDTILGPVVIAGSWGFDGRWRTYLGIGRLFR